MGDKHQFTPHHLLSAIILWTILLLASLQVTTASFHHHSVDHQQQQSHHHHRHHRRLDVEVQKNNLPADVNKSSKFWLINSNPHPHQPNNGWGFRGWHNYLTSTAPPPPPTTTTTTVRPLPVTPFPSLWRNNHNNNGNYPSKRSNWNPNRSNSTRNPLNPKHG